MEDLNQYYITDVESRRLFQDEGPIEFDRTKTIIERYIHIKNGIIYDIGGGDGIYSRWLAEKGFETHLFDISTDLIDFALKQNTLRPLIKSIQVADARRLEVADNSCDIVLLFGPLYHLTDLSERMKALKEAYRVLKLGGLLFVSAISRYGSLLKSLIGYGSAYNTFAEAEFQSMVKLEITSGLHIRPKIYPSFLPNAYFHLPEELEYEIRNCGFNFLDLISIEGPFWMNKTFQASWHMERPRIEAIIASIEKDRHLMPNSLHFMGIGSK